MLFRRPLSSGLGCAPFSDAILARMGRPLLALLIVLAALGVFAGGLAWLLDTPRPPAGGSSARRVFPGPCSTGDAAGGDRSRGGGRFPLPPPQPPPAPA